MPKLVWMIAGSVALAVGLVGIAVPLLPTAPLLLLAAFCFARSSPRLEMWLVEHRRLGPPIRDWRAEGAISRRGKAAAVVAISLTFAISLALGLRPLALMAQAAVLGAVVVFLVTRPEPQRPQAYLRQDERRRQGIRSEASPYEKKR